MPIVFKAKLTSPMEGKGWTFARLPKAASARLPARGRVPIQGTINGFPFRTSAFPDGDGSHTIQVNATMRDGGKAASGQTAAFVIDVVTDAVNVVVPPALRSALATSAAALAQWDAITPKARAEWVQWIVSAKQDETRARRIGRTVERLARGDKRFSD